ncbi:MAG: nucleotide exchange factor GrpE [Clostridiaceae bacterium]|nr:nucleotide exchange factor GrpE [Clostridiaceae bacterium]
MEDNNKEILEENEVNLNEDVLQEENEVIDNEEVINEDSAEKSETEENTEVSEESNEDELDMLRKSKDEIKKLNSELETYKDRLVRLTAEYENFRKRTAKEKEGIYTDACVDVLKEIVPSIDNLERASAAEGNLDDLKKGVEMTLKGLQNSLEKLGVEEIDASGEFDPNLHQAVMHVEDENLEKNVVAEVFMKGYKRGEKVIRHSVVKVAN